MLRNVLKFSNATGEKTTANSADPYLNFVFHLKVKTLMILQLNLSLYAG